jgi:hypothetical protein
MERTGSTTSSGRGQGPAMTAEQLAAQAMAADTHTQAPAHSGAPIRTFYSLQAAQDHVRQQEVVITEQARNLETLSNRMDTMSIQLAQLLGLVRHRDVVPTMGGRHRSADRSAERDATSALERPFFHHQNLRPERHICANHRQRFRPPEEIGMRTRTAKPDGNF